MPAVSGPNATLVTAAATAKTASDTAAAAATAAAAVSYADRAKDGGGTLAEEYAKQAAAITALQATIAAKDAALAGVTAQLVAI